MSDKKLHILEVVPYFYPAWFYGGPGKVVYDISNKLLKNHEVTIFTTDAFNATQRMDRTLRLKSKNNLKIYYFKNISNILAAKYNIYLSFEFFLESFKIIKKVDVIHFHDFYILHNVWISFLSVIYHKPYIVSAHGCLESRRVAEKSVLKKIFMKLFGNLILKHSSICIAISQSEIISYLINGVPKEKIRYIPNGVNLDEMKPEISKEQFKKNFNIPQNKIIFTYLGRIHKIKGLDFLIKAIAKLDQEDWHFIISGPDHGFLIELQLLIKKHHLSDKISLIKAQFGSKKYDLLNATDVFVYPSYSEGFSLAILEAAGFGIPLLITKGCNFDQIASSGAGLIIDHNDQVFNTSVKIMLNNRVREKFAKNAKQLIVSKFSLDQMIKKLVNLYKEVAV